MRTIQYTLLAILLVTLPAQAGSQLDSRESSLITRLSRAYITIELLPDEEVAVEGFVVEEATLRDFLPFVSRDATVLVTSQPGIPWSRDCALREAILLHSEARECIYLATDEVPLFLATRQPGPIQNVEGEVEVNLERLASSSWEVREEGLQSLISLGPVALPHLQAFASHPDPEVAWRVQRAIDVASNNQALNPAYLGIGYEYLPEEEGASIRIRQVFPSTQAEAFELRGGDRILQMNAKPLTNFESVSEVANIFRGLRSGQRLDLTMARDDEVWVVGVRLGGWRD